MPPRRSLRSAPYQCVFLQRMFCICSVMIRLARESHKVIRRLVLISAGAVAAMVCPAHAQDRLNAPTAGGASPIEPESGYRKAESPNGFRLIEHGIWEASSTGALGAVVEDASRRAY